MKRHEVAVEVCAADLSSAGGLETAATRLADRSRPLDLLVNSAGTGTDHRFTGSPVAAEVATTDLNVTATPLTR